MAFYSQFRIVHFMIFAIVVLTIFLYSVIYNEEMIESPVIHAGSAHHLFSSSSSSISISSNSGDSSLRSIRDNILETNHNRIDEEPSPSLGAYIDDAVIRKTADDEQQLQQQQPLDVRIELKDGNKGDEQKNVYHTENVNTSSAQNASKSIASNITPSKQTSVEAKSTAKSDKTLGNAINTTLIASTVSSAANKTSTSKADGVKVLHTSDIYEPGFSEPATHICQNNGDQLRLLILVTSAPTHHDQRLAIRQSWGHFGSRRDIAIGFILGQTDNVTQEDALAAESYMYNDLIRGHFVDSYNNLTLKTVSSLEWVDTFCPNASFFLKTDDDMFINIPRLLQFIEKHHNDKRTIYGRLARKWKPIRNTKSKYYVSPQQYFPSIFPHFCTGPAYLITNDCISGLYKKSLDQAYLKLEDVYTTGIVAQMLNIKRVHVTEFLNRRIAFNQCNIKKAISLHMVKPNEQFDLWKKLLDTSIKCK